MQAGLPGLPGEAVPNPQEQGAVACVLGGARVADAGGQPAAFRPPRPGDPPVEQDLPHGVPALALRRPLVPVPHRHAAEHVHRVQVLTGADALDDTDAPGCLIRGPHLPPVPDGLHRAVLPGVRESGA